MDQITANLRKADVEVGKGKKAHEIYKLQDVTKQTYLSLASKVWWSETSDGQATESIRERESTAKEDGCRASSRYGHCQRGRQGKLLGPERRRRTVSTIRHRLGRGRILERRACCVLGQPRDTQRYKSRRANDEPALLHEMRLLSRQRPRFGSDRNSFIGC